MAKTIILTSDSARKIAQKFNGGDKTAVALASALVGTIAAVESNRRNAIHLAGICTKDAADADRALREGRLPNTCGALQQSERLNVAVGRLQAGMASVEEIIFVCRTAGILNADAEYTF